MAVGARLAKQFLSLVGKGVKNLYEIYGVAYNSTIILQQLISPRRYNPIALHATYSHAQVKAEVERTLGESRCVPVVLAGNLYLARTFVRLFAHVKAKLVLCECPPFLNPPCSDVLQWLDCDLQAAGAWQVAKIKPEDFMEMLDKLEVLGDRGKQYLAAVRYVDDDDERLDLLHKFSVSIPKYYKDAIATLDPVQNKSPLKALKETRKTKDTLRNLLTTTLDGVSKKHRKDLAKLVLDYQIALVTKREYLSMLTKTVDDDGLRKDFLTLRKWMDSKAGSMLKDAFYEMTAQQSSVSSVMETYKKIAEDDLHLLAAHFDALHGSTGTVTSDANTKIQISAARLDEFLNF